MRFWRTDVSLAKPLLITAVLLHALLAARTCLAESVTPPPGQKFTDSAGRSVDLPAQVERIIPAGPPAAVLLYALAPEKLAGLIEAWTDRQKVFVPEAYRGLPVLPRLTRPTSEADIAALRGTNAGLIVDYGDIGPAYVTAAEKAQAALAVPCLLLDGRMAQIPGTLRSLGTILGRKERGEELAGLAAEVLERLRPVTALAQEVRVPVYLARGADGLLGVRPGGSPGEAIELAGGRNVTPNGAGSFAKFTPLEVAALNPAFVILEDPAAADGPLLKALDPKTVILVDRGEPFGSMEAPPSVNRLIGALALASILHPDLVSPGAPFMRRVREGFFDLLPSSAPVFPLERLP